MSNINQQNVINNTTTPSVLPISSICDQLQKLAHYNVPPPRYTPISPYATTNYSNFDLNMRRKAEVLKYNNNNSSTKTNNLTKAQKWALIMNGNATRNSISASLMNQDTVIKETDSVKVVKCGDQLIRTPVSSSGVPSGGNTNYLYNDESVLLYNYKRITNYGIINSEVDINPWYFTQYSNIICLNNIQNNFASIRITPSIDSNSYSFNYQNPLILQVYGKNNNKTTSRSIQYNVSVSPNIYIYYNNELVDVQGKVSQITMDNSQFKVNVDANANSTFNSSLSIGNIYISDIFLYTFPGYIYDLYLKFSINVLDSGYIPADLTVSYAITVNPTA
jgi:hypothetical protein